MEPPAPDPPALRVLQLLVFALIAGVVLFGIIALFAQPPAGQTSANVATLRLVCVIMVVGVLPAALLARHAMLRASLPERRPGAPASAGVADREGLFGRFQAATIVSAALLEGAGLFAVVVFLLSRDPVDLALAALPVLALLAAVFPTSGRWRRLVRYVEEGSFR